MGKYSHFIFDIDGTLIDTERTGVMSLQQTVKEKMGIDMPYEEAYGYFGIPSAKVAPMLGYADEEGFLELWEKRFQELMHLMDLFPGVTAMLHEVKAAGLHTGMVTSRSAYELSHDPLISMLQPYIDVTVCAEDSERHKPDPDPILAYFRKSGGDAAPAECIYIGDTIYDCRCAHGAGCDFALADWRKRGLQGITPEYHLTEVGQILDLI